MNGKSRLEIHILGLLILIGATVCVSCSQRQTQIEPTVIVSIPPLAFFVEKIGGDKVKVETMAPAGADPETFEPSMVQMRKLADSPLLLTTGLLPFEDKLQNTVGDDTTIINLSDSINVISGTHGDGEADPHIWTSLRNARVMARQTARALSAAFPEYADYFAANLAELDADLVAQDLEISARLLPYRGRPILVWHPSLSYFARDYGLYQIVLGEENKETSISRLRSKIDRALADSALVFFYQKDFDSRKAKIVTDATGLQPVDLAPLSPEISSTITSVANAITQ